LDLIAALRWEAFPPRLPEQPFFYPITNREYADHITLCWNVNAYGAGYTLRFKVNENFLKKYSVQKVGADIHTEYWIPAEDLNEFNKNIIGHIEIIHAFKNGSFNL
jgi:hypothetical protein